MSRVHHRLIARLVGCSEVRGCGVEARQTRYIQHIIVVKTPYAVAALNATFTGYLSTCDPATSEGLPHTILMVSLSCPFLLFVHIWWHAAMLFSRVHTCNVALSKRIYSTMKILDLISLPTRSSRQTASRCAPKSFSSRIMLRAPPHIRNNTGGMG